MGLTQPITWLEHLQGHDKVGGKHLLFLHSHWTEYEISDLVVEAFEAASKKNAYDAYGLALDYGVAYFDQATYL